MWLSWMRASSFWSGSPSRFQGRRGGRGGVRRLQAGEPGRGRRLPSANRGPGRLQGCKGSLRRGLPLLRGQCGVGDAGHARQQEGLPAVLQRPAGHRPGAHQHHQPRLLSGRRRGGRGQKSAGAVGLSAWIPKPQNIRLLKERMRKWQLSNS